MKKSAKLISMLLVLTMLLGIIPMAVAAGTDVSLGRTKLGDAVLEQATPGSFNYLRDLSGNTANKDIGEYGLWQRLPVNTLVGYGSVSAVNYAVPAENSVTVSNPGVIGDFSFSLERWAGNEYTPVPPCLQFNYKALKTGTTTVTVTYFYNYGLINVAGGTTWYKETATFTVHVSENEVQMPTALPSLKSRGAVYYYCRNSTNDYYNHSLEAVLLSNVPSGCSFGNIMANDGRYSQFTRAQYPWMVELTVDKQAFLDAYNNTYEEEDGIRHYLQKGEDQYDVVTFFAKNNATKWSYLTNDIVVINMDHTAPAPVETKYTVTYTDGVNGEAFANQIYTVKSGEATPAFEGTPTREGYAFLGWEPEVAETVTGNATYTAKWEEALTSVTLKRIGSGNLFFLGDTLTLRATANTAANITLDLDHAAFELTSQETSEDGKTTTFVYTVKKITGSWMRLNIIATATKGAQEPVKSANLSVEANLRNRIHVKITENGQPVTDAAVQLMHKYPKWNTCPMLKYDEAKGEYVMKNPWDLSNQPYSSLKITAGGEEYTVDKDKFGEALANVVTCGTEEIYVEYKIVSPIDVEIYVNDKLVATKTYKGSEGDTPDYKDFYWVISNRIQADGKMVMSQATECDGTKLAFGSCKKVKVKLYTYLTGITATGDDYVFDNSGITATIDGIEWATGSNDSGSTDSGISATAPDFSFDN